MINKTDNSLAKLRERKTPLLKSGIGGNITTKLKKSKGLQRYAMNNHMPTNCIT